VKGYAEERIVISYTECVMHPLRVCMVFHYRQDVNNSLFVLNPVRRTKYAQIIKHSQNTKTNF